MKPSQPRPKQQLPADIITDILGAIRGSFYGDLPPKRWFEDTKFLTRRVVTWPAKWLDSRGVSLPPERYKAILMDILQTIKHKGNTGVVSYWPGYLAHCVQEHFKHHGESYYEEGKALRAKLDIALSTCRSAVVRQPDPIRTLAEVHQVLSASTPRRHPKSAQKPPQQMDLF